jgi:hypothetical protein
VNFKKQTGKPDADHQRIEEHARRDATRLGRQLDLISPDIIVCGGGGGVAGARWLFRLAQEIFPDAGAATELARTTSPHIPSMAFRGPRWLSIDFVHPSSRGRGMDRSRKHATLADLVRRSVSAGWHPRRP